MRPELTRASHLLRTNSPEAVSEAIALLQDTVFSFSMKMCGHREDAEDTAQEVLFSSLKHLHKLEDPSALAAWLYTVTRNRCHRMRGGADASPSRRLSLDELMPDVAGLGQLLLDTAESPEKSLLHAEEKQLLHQALLRIPTPLRLVLVLHDMEDLDTGMVARILGLQTGTVRVRLHRARLALRKEIAQLLEKSVPRRDARPRSRPARPVARATVRRPRDCSKIFAELSEYIDGKLDPKACDKMRKHIEACPACVAFLRDLRAAIDRCRSMEVACDPSVTERLQVMLTREYLRMMGKSAPGGRKARL